MKQHLFPGLLITALLAVSALAAGQVSAQQASELFSAVPEGTQTPPSLGVRSNTPR